MDTSFHSRTWPQHNRKWKASLRNPSESSSRMAEILWKKPCFEVANCYTTALFMDTNGYGKSNVAESSPSDKLYRLYVSCRHRSGCGLYHLFQAKVDNVWVIRIILQISLMLKVIIDIRLKDWKRHCSKRQYTLPLLWYIYFIQHLGTENVFMCDLLRLLWHSGNDAKGGETN